MFHIKARRKGDKAFRFLSSGEQTTRLRVHAVQFRPERVEAVLADLARDNPGLEFVARPIPRRFFGGEG